jgi:predicted RNA-binding Zn-ribbon protein involved in translation (DUF1610 family)
MDPVTIQQAYTGLKFAIDTLRTVVGTKAQIAADGKIADALEHLGRVQDTMFELRNTLATLQEENRALKESQREHNYWHARSAEYPLTQASGGAMVRKAAGPPEHYICPRCFEDRKIYPLQNKRTVTTGEYSCPGCGKGFLVDAPGKLPEINYGSRGGANSWMRRW